MVFIDRKVVQTQDIDMSETHIIGKYGSFKCHILSRTTIYICSHPKTSLNSLTPHGNNISGQRGSKSRVSEHESSAPPVDMYGTTSLSWSCVFKVCRQSRKTFLFLFCFLLRSADKVGRPFCFCSVSYYFFYSFFFFFTAICVSRFLPYFSTNLDKIWHVDSTWWDEEMLEISSQ